MYWIVLAFLLLLFIGLFIQYRKDKFYKSKSKRSKKLEFQINKREDFKNGN